MSKWQLVLDLVRSKECTASCIFGLEGTCTCRCKGANHGLGEKMAELNDTENPLVGKFFHSTQVQDDGCEVIEWQGHVLGMIDGSRYLVQLFEWLVGSPTEQRIIRLDAMENWRFYEDAEDMQFGYQESSLGRSSERHHVHSGQYDRQEPALWDGS